MLVLGWCNDGFHIDYTGPQSAPCKGSYESLVLGEKGRGSKKTIVTLDRKTVSCECPCHSGTMGLGRHPALNTTRRRKK